MNFLIYFFVQNANDVTSVNRPLINEALIYNAEDPFGGSGFSKLIT